MRSAKAKFSWVTFGITLSALLAIGGVIVTYISPVLLELIKNIIILIFISLLVSVVFGYRRFIWNTLSKVWTPIAKWIALKYIQKRMKEYSSEICILGLRNNSGAVNLILEAGVNDGVSPGMGERKTFFGGCQAGKPKRGYLRFYPSAQQIGRWI